MALQNPINIPLGGLSTSPSDYLCDDGSLAAAINVVHEDGALHPFHESAPSIVATLNDFTVIIQHHNMDYRHLILRDKDGFVCWFDLQCPSVSPMEECQPVVLADNVHYLPDLSTNTNLSGVVRSEVMGNMLILYTATNVHYFLFRPADKDYRALGNNLPEINLQFGLQSQFHINEKEFDDRIYIKYEDGSAEDAPDIEKFFIDNDAMFDPTRKKRVTEAVHGSISKFIKTMNDRGRFVMPFLVRYGYHLKTSASVVSNLSAPILMVPSTIVPIVDSPCWDFNDDNDIEIFYSVSGVSSALYYKVLNASVKKQLEDWADLIDSVAIYISAPIYTYDTDSDIARFSWVNEKAGEWNLTMFDPVTGGSGMHFTLSFNPDKAKFPVRELLKQSVIVGGLRKFTEGRVEESDFVFDNTVTDNIISGEDICRINNVAGSSDTDFTKTSGFIVPTSPNGHLGLGTDDSNGKLNDYWFAFCGDYNDKKGHYGEPNELFRKCLSMFALMPERYPDSKILDDISNVSTFFLLDTVKLSKIDSDPHIIRKDAGYLHNIVAHQKLQNDDFNSRSVRIPKVTSVYNNRLNIANFSESLNEAALLSLATQHCTLGSAAAGVPTPSAASSRAALPEDELHGSDHDQDQWLPNEGETGGTGTGSTPSVPSNPTFPTISGALYIYAHVASINRECWFKAVRDTNNIAPVLFFLFLNVPDVDHVLIYQVVDDHTLLYADLAMTNHRGLNGSYWHASAMLPEGLPFQRITITGSIEDYLTTIESGMNLSDEPSVVQNSNLILTSEVASPFTFLASNSAEVGSGAILAMVPITTALSQGQFGAYPMYCFTTEGVWALQPNETGGWSSAAPISRDVVLTNPDTGDAAILQLDQSIIFATDRGLIQITGSHIDCISEVFDGDNDIFTRIYIGHIGKVLEQNTDIPLAYSKSFVGSDGKTIIVDADIYPDEYTPGFKGFCSNGIFTYDYANQRIIIGNPSFDCIYIFSMKDKQWTTAPLTITKAVNSYPQSFAVADGLQCVPPNLEGQEAAATPCNYLIDFSNAVTITDPAILRTATTGFILTRPLKFDSPDILKTVRQIDIRGTFHEASRTTSRAALGSAPDEHRLAMFLYGTNDNSLHRWHRITSCYGARLSCRLGTPYKFYRVAIISHLQPGESIHSLQVLFETREDAKIQ